MHTKEEKLKSILVIVLGFLVLYFIFEVPALLYVSAVVGIGSMLFGWFEKAVLWVWFKIAHILGWINTRILLSIVFYVFLFPMGLLYRALTKNPLQLKRVSKSVYQERDHTYTKEDLENIW